MGTVLGTFTCTDLDSPGSAMDYQLRFHSPSVPTSLCLRDRVLKVPPAAIPSPTGRVLGLGVGGMGREAARGCGSGDHGVKEMVMEPTCFAVWRTGVRVGHL